METPVTAEAVFDSHAIALGLPKRKNDESLSDYVARVAKGDEAERRLNEAVAAAKLADHANVQHWLAQARHEIKNPYPPDRR